MVLRFSFVLSLCFIWTLGDSGLYETYSEELLLRPQKSGFTEALFRFNIFTETSDDDRSSDSPNSKHYRLFPKPLGDLQERFQFQELHLSLTQGFWHSSSFGTPVDAAPTGAELWVWFDPAVSTGGPSLDENYELKSVLTRNGQWRSLTHTLSGMFCASLNFMDETNTIRPRLSFRPVGVSHKTLFGPRGNRYVRYAQLPKEVVCTENLTPFRKLLPCGNSKRYGLASLFSGIRLFDANYHSLQIDLHRECITSDCSRRGLRLVLSLGVVIDSATSRSLSETHSEISLKSLFGVALPFVCPLADSSKLIVAYDGPYSVTELQSAAAHQINGTSWTLVVFDYNEAFQKAEATESIDHKMQLIWRKTDGQTMSFGPDNFMSVHRYSTGSGQVDGGVVTLLYNNLPRNIQVVLMDHMPWYFQFYYHTLNVTNAMSEPVKPLRVLYQQGRIRGRPYLLEMGLELPANSHLRVEYSYAKHLLKWTEYPPDPNLGFVLPSGVVTVEVDDVIDVLTPSRLSNHSLASVVEAFRNDTIRAKRKTVLRLYTEPLLGSFPLPDFSMPYNVICLVCTAVAMAFGSLYNVTTTDYCLVDPEKSRSIPRRLMDRVKALLARKAPTQNVADDTTAASDNGTSADQDDGQDGPTENQT